MAYDSENTLINNGFTLQFGDGPDIPEADLELKTHCRQSNSGVTMGRQTMQKVMELSYDHSMIKRKLQNILYLEYDRDLQIYTHRYLIDFRNPEIQDIIRKDYDFGRTWFASNPGSSSSPQQNHFAYWEKSQGTVQFRMRPQKFLNLDGIARSIEIRNQLFTWEPTK